MWLMRAIYDGLYGITDPSAEIDFRVVVLLWNLLPLLEKNPKKCEVQ